MWLKQYNTVYQNEAGADGAESGGNAGDNSGNNSGQDTSDSDAVAAAIGGDNGSNGDQSGGEPEGWFFADGVAGEGEAPEWFKGDKYKSVAEQAKAYTELEGRFGSFTGAPENYDIAISEELTEQGVQIDSDDPMMEEAVKFAKEANMSQEGFNSMVNLYAMTKLAENNAIEQTKADEIAALGNNANQRLSNLDAWGKANLSEDLYQGFQEMATTAESVKALERLVAMTRNAPVSPDAVRNAPSVSAEEVRAMQFEKDEFGNRRIQTDPDFKARYVKLRDEVWGGDEHRVIVGN